MFYSKIHKPSSNPCPDPGSAAGLEFDSACSLPRIPRCVVTTFALLAFWVWGTGGFLFMALYFANHVLVTELIFSWIGIPSHRSWRISLPTIAFTKLTVPALSRTFGFAWR